MKRTVNVLLVGAACLALGALPSLAGNIVGKVSYGGTPPPQKSITVTKDKDVCGREAHPDETLVLAPDKGIANVVVYIKDAPNAPKMALPAASMSPRPG